jgi:sensor histidine kinase YesM
MKVRLPVNNLIRLNILLSAVVSTIVCIFLYQDHAGSGQLRVATVTFVGINIIGAANILILIILTRKFKTSSIKFKVYRYISTYVAATFAYLLIWPFFKTISHPIWKLSDPHLLFEIFISGASANTMVVFLHDFIFLQNEKSRAETEVSRLKVAHAEAAILLLKQQIHPHFLFNALNTLKALYHTEKTGGDAYIVHLANFLRASVFHNASNIARLKDEVKILQDYLEMQQIRFGTALQCQVSIDESSSGELYLPAFSLQPLLENALKHNDLTRKSPLKIMISQTGHWLTISNNLQKKSMPVFSTNSGLANLAERYRLWSGDEIIIKEDEHFFSVSIKLLNNEGGNY